MKCAFLLVAFACSGFAVKLATPQLLDLASHPADSTFAHALTDTLGEKALQDGTAVIGQGPDFLWAVKASSPPDLYVDGQRAATLTRVGSTGLWFCKGSLRTGTSHVFHYVIDGQRFGGKNDIPAYGPESYVKPGVPQGKLSEKMVHTSKIYDGMKSDWWIYVPAQYDAAKPAALMVWHDGQGMASRNGDANSLNVFDNLTAEGKIPVMIQVFVAPGKIGDKAMRSIEYDTVSDVYARFLRDEIMPEVYAKYNIRKDGYSRAIAGNSSGGISFFNVAWQQNDQYTRCLLRIASFASLQENHKGEFDGGNTFPYRVRNEPKHKIRVWTQDGAEDLQNRFGDWPSNNINMANSLKFREYDFHFSFGVGTHNGAQGNAELPEAMTWLWRGYDASKTDDDFPMDPAEKSKPYFRVKTFTREP